MSEYAYLERSLLETLLIVTSSGEAITGQGIARFLGGSWSHYRHRKMMKLVADGLVRHYKMGRVNYYSATSDARDFYSERVKIARHRQVWALAIDMFE